MLRKIGVVGILGVLLMLGGIGVMASENLYIAAGAAFVVAGMGFVVYGMVRGIFKSLGLGEMP
jgi:hypothetical protein